MIVWYCAYWGSAPRGMIGGTRSFDSWMEELAVGRSARFPTRLEHISPIKAVQLEIWCMRQRLFQPKSVLSSIVQIPQREAEGADSSLCRVGRRREWNSQRHWQRPGRWVAPHTPSSLACPSAIPTRQHPHAFPSWNVPDYSCALSTSRFLLTAYQFPLRVSHSPLLASRFAFGFAFHTLLTLRCLSRFSLESNSHLMFLTPDTVYTVYFTVKIVPKWYHFVSENTRKRNENSKAACPGTPTLVKQARFMITPTRGCLLLSEH